MSSYVEREYPRYAHYAELAASFNGQLVEGYTVNVSRGGLCAMVLEALPLGSDLQIDLTLCFDDGALSEPLSLRSRIVWCTAIDDKFQLGLSFVNVDTRTLEDLEMFLRFLDQREATQT